VDPFAERLHCYWKTDLQIKQLLNYAKEFAEDVQKNAMNMNTIIVKNVQKFVPNVLMNAEKCNRSILKNQEK
jgi:hypothetical protein